MHITKNELMISVQFDSILVKDKLLCGLEIFDHEAQKWLYEIMSCGETQLNNIFAPAWKKIFCTDEFQLCDVDRSFSSFVDLSFRLYLFVSFIVIFARINNTDGILESSIKT